MPEEVAALREAARRLLAGDPKAAVAAFLAREVPPRRGGGVWSSNALRSTLRSEAADRLIWSPAERKALREAGILSKAEKERRRADWGTVGTGHAGRSGARLLSSLLACSGCGGVLYSSPLHKRPGYRCMTRSSGLPCPSPMTVSALPVERLVEEAFLAGWGVLGITTVTILDAVVDEIAEEEDRLEALWDALPATPAAERPALLADAAAAEAHIEALRAQPPRTLAMLTETGETYAGRWHRGSMPERRALLARVLEGRPLEVLPPTTLGPRVDPARLPGLWRLDPAAVDAAHGL